MRYLIDTCIISEMIKPHPQASVLSWWDNCVSCQIYISSLTIGELRFGITRLPDGKKKVELLAIINKLFRLFPVESFRLLIQPLLYGLI
jgi:predicted nucleic acid-binding protein